MAVARVKSSVWLIVSMHSWQHKRLNKDEQASLKALFDAVFSQAESEAEGRLVGDLAGELALAIDNQQVWCFATYEAQQLIAAIFLTRLDFDQDIDVYLLGPVAVATEHQGQGVGQALIRYGLAQLKAQAVELVITYGDPAFYSKVGFQRLSEQQLKAPLPLSMPQGWQVVSLTDAPIPSIAKRPTCVKAFDNPAYW